MNITSIPICMYVFFCKLYLCIYAVLNAIDDDGMNTQWQKKIVLRIVGR